MADNERGFSSEEFTNKLGRAGTLYLPTAGYAPWQKGKVERKIESFKTIIKKTVIHSGVTGEEMRMCGLEAVATLNQRPGPTGVSAAMMLFGQKLKMYGEIYANGEPHTHPDGTDRATDLGRRLEIRNSTRQAAEAHHAKELLRKTVAAKTRKVENTAVGEIIYFYRCYPGVKAQKLQAKRGCFLGPGVVIGKQGQNVWVSYAGRCYLVAPEHVRSLAPDETASLRPIIRHGLEQLQQASRAEDFVDLSEEQVDEAEMETAAQEAEGDVPQELLPDLLERTLAPLQAPREEGDPLLIIPPEPVANAGPEGEALDVQEEQEDMVVDQRGTKREQPASSSGLQGAAVPQPPQPSDEVVTWQPTGNATDMRWKRNVAKKVLTVNKPRVMTDKIKKKLLDKEVPFHLIPEKDRPLYEKAEEKEWNEWLRRGSVRVMTLKESQDVNETVDKARIIGLRFVYRDKNASIRTPQIDLPVNAKARLCAQAYDEPLAKAGLIKVDAPTIQRVGVMVFLQLLVNFQWIPYWRKGDVTAAFLQGKKRDVEKNGRLYLRQPKGRNLPGVPAGCLLEVLLSVYGLPDAPRAWFEEITGFMKEMGFQHSRVDPAFMVWYYEDGSIGIMCVLHVDDIMIANDGTDRTEKLVAQLHEKYPFGEWTEVHKIGSITYTGRTILVKGTEVWINQQDFIEGRMTLLKHKKEKGQDKDRECTELEKADYKSGVGDLHWVTSQTRIDHAVDTSALQKRQQAPKYSDYLYLGRTIKEVKETAGFSLRIVPISNPCIGAWTDSALYGAEGETFDRDSDLEGYDKHKVYSQRGAFIAMVSLDCLDDVGDVPISLVDWRTKASKRVHHSTFAAEAQSATEAHGLAMYFRAYWCDVLFGAADWMDIDMFGEEQMKVILFTDCKSLFDHLKKEGAVPDDKWTAVAVASLKCRVSAGPDRNLSKSECRWVASRWQLADCLTKAGLAYTLREILQKGATRLHELSLQEIGRQKNPDKPKRKKKKASEVHYCSSFASPSWKEYFNPTGGSNVCDDDTTSGSNNTSNTTTPLPSTHQTYFNSTTNNNTTSEQAPRGKHCTFVQHHSPHNTNNDAHMLPTNTDSTDDDATIKTGLRLKSPPPTLVPHSQGIRQEGSMTSSSQSSSSTSSSLSSTSKSKRQLLLLLSREVHRLAAAVAQAPRAFRGLATHLARSNSSYPRVAFRSNSGPEGEGGEQELTPTSASRLKSTQAMGVGDEEAKEETSGWWAPEDEKAARVRLNYVHFPPEIVATFKEAPEWNVDIKKLVSNVHRVLDVRQRERNDKALDEVGEFVSTGSTMYDRIRPLEPDLVANLIRIDDKISNLGTILLEEFPWLRSRPDRIQCVFMREWLPQKHKDYANEKAVRKGWAEAECYYTLKPWLCMAINDEYKWSDFVPAFHGTPLSMALRLISSGGHLRQEFGQEVNRTRSVDKLRPDEAYSGPFGTALQYTLPQVWQSANPSVPGDAIRLNRKYICVAGVTAESMRVQRGSKANKDIKIITKGQPLFWLFREDRDDVLTDANRCMSNWKDPFEEARRLQADKKNKIGPHPESQRARRRAAKEIAVEATATSSSQRDAPQQDADLANAPWRSTKAGPEGEAAVVAEDQATSDITVGVKPLRGSIAAELSQVIVPKKQILQRSTESWLKEDEQHIAAVPKSANTTPGRRVVPPPPSLPPSDDEKEEPDQDLINNTKAMSKVRDQTGFRTTTGRLMHVVMRGPRKVKMEIEELDAEGWPTDDCVGSTFSHDKWIADKEAMQFQACFDPSWYDPVGKGDPEMDPDADFPDVITHEDSLSDVQGDVHAERQLNRELTKSERHARKFALDSGHMTTLAKTSKVRQDLKHELCQLRAGTLYTGKTAAEQKEERQRIWAPYTQQQLLFALRRGSDALHIHVASALQSRFRKTMQQLAGYRKEMALREDLSTAIIAYRVAAEHGDQKEAERVLRAPLAGSRQLQALIDEVRGHVKQISEATHGEVPGHAVEQVAGVVDELEAYQADLAEIHDEHDTEDHSMTGIEVIDHALGECKVRILQLKERIIHVRGQTSDSYVDPKDAKMMSKGMSHKDIKKYAAGRITRALHNMEGASSRAQQAQTLDKRWVMAFDHGVEDLPIRLNTEAEEVLSRPEVNPTKEIDKLGEDVEWEKDPYAHIEDDIPQEPEKVVKRPPMTTQERWSFTAESAQQTPPWMLGDRKETLGGSLVQDPDPTSSRSRRIAEGKQVGTLARSLLKKKLAEERQERQQSKPPKLGKGSEVRDVGDARAQEKASSSTAGPSTKAGPEGEAAVEGTATRGKVSTTGSAPRAVTQVGRKKDTKLADHFTDDEVHEMSGGKYMGMYSKQAPPADLDVPLPRLHKAWQDYAPRSTSEWRDAQEGRAQAASFARPRPPSVPQWKKSTWKDEHGDHHTVWGESEVWGKDEEMQPQEGLESWTSPSASSTVRLTEAPSQQDANADKRTRSQRAETLCRFYNAPQGCKFGNSCQYKHEKGDYRKW